MPRPARRSGVRIRPSVMAFLNSCRVVGARGYAYDWRDGPEPGSDTHPPRPHTAELAIAASPTQQPGLQPTLLRAFVSPVRAPRQQDARVPTNAPAEVERLRHITTHNHAITVTTTRTCSALPAAPGIGGRIRVAGGGARRGPPGAISLRHSLQKARGGCRLPTVRQHGGLTWQNGRKADVASTSTLLLGRAIYTGRASAGGVLPAAWMAQRGVRTLVSWTASRLHA